MSFLRLFAQQFAFSSSSSSASSTGITAAALSSTAKIIQAQESLLRHHLPADVYSRIESPRRHQGINSIKVKPTNSTTRKSDSTKPPLVVLHGFGSGLGFFFATLPYLAASGDRDVYLVDWLGCGGSERPVVDHHSLKPEFFTTSLNDWMDAEGISKATIVGHSLGGLLSKIFSDKHPEKVANLVLASPVGFGAAPANNKRNDSYSRQMLDVLWSSNFTPQHLIRVVSENRGRTMVSRAIQARFNNPSHFHAPLLADYLYEITVAPPCGEYALNALVHAPFQEGALVARHPITEMPGGGKFPVHVIYGDHDWLGTPSAVQNARKTGSKVSIMRNAGHHLYLDDPKEFARLCLA